MTFDTKLQLILTLNVLGSIKKKDLLKFMIELDIYLLLNNVTEFLIGLEVKRV